MVKLSFINKGSSQTKTISFSSDVYAFTFVMDVQLNLRIASLINGGDKEQRKLTGVHSKNDKKIIVYQYDVTLIFRPDMQGFFSI